MAISNKTSEVHRLQMIAEAARFRAEKRGFSSGEEFRDWLEGEAVASARRRTTSSRNWS